MTFGEGRDVAIRRHNVTASFDIRPTPRWTIQIGGGATLAGRIELADVGYAIHPGWIASVAGSFAILDGSGALPFLVASLSLAGSGAHTTPDPERAGEGSESLYAFDGRIGLTVGKTFWNVVSPYLAVRAFGGPVFWSVRGEDLTGTDKYHVQPAVGLMATFARRVDVFAEVAPVLERAVTAGAGVAF